MSKEINTLIKENKLTLTEDVDDKNSEFHVVFDRIKGTRYWMIYQRWPKWVRFLNRNGWFFEKHTSPELAHKRTAFLNQASNSVYK